MVVVVLVLVLVVVVVAAPAVGPIWNYGSKIRSPVRDEGGKHSWF